jgi:hypothetical protein
MNKCQNQEQTPKQLLSALFRRYHAWIDKILSEKLVDQSSNDP